MSYAILFDRPKIEHNIGTAMRSCYNFGADMIITIGRRYCRQAADTTNTLKHIPMLHFASFDEYCNHALVWPHVAIEITEDAEEIRNFCHPESCVYMFGPEDGSLSVKAQSIAIRKVKIPTRSCLNLGVTASCVMFDRLMKIKKV